MTRGFCGLASCALTVSRSRRHGAALAYNRDASARQVRRTRACQSLYKMGVVSVPIVALTALFTGGTMVIQSGIFVQRFQAYGLLGWGRDMRCCARSGRF